MSQQELLKYAVSTLEDAGIPYMITGSTVSSLQGQPRATHDIDIVVSIETSAIAVLLRAFQPPRFYLDEDAIRHALATFSMFNVIDSEGGDKIDFWILRAEDFDQSRFGRRYREVAADTSMYVSRPEDTILGKLLWANASGGSEKQISDCVAVYEVNHARLDMDYLQTWAQKLGVVEMLDRVQTEAQA